MTIGIDIDDTMTSSSELIKEYAKKYFGSNDTELINSITYSPRIEGELLEFYQLYLLEMMSNYELKPNVKEVIDRLQDKGHKIIIITGRGYTPQNGVISTTTKYLQKHNINVDKVLFKALDKSDYCVKYGIDIMIDDSAKVLEKVRKKGINVLMFNSISNQSINTDINKVDSWLEVEQYIDKIK